MRIDQWHAWDLSPREAITLQRKLAPRVIREGDLSESQVHLIAGADVAFDKPNARGIAAVVALDWPSLDVVERVTVEAPVTFPYVPGLLSFRETPLLLAAFEQLRSTPDLVMVDGHGFAHPRRFGFACHIGLMLGLPTIGVAKSRLIGSHEAVESAHGSRSDLTDNGEVIGAVLRTRERVRPIYVSVGHRIGLRAAERWALACAKAYRVPEPTRLADKLSRDGKRVMLDATLEIVVEQRSGEAGRWEWDRDKDEVVFRHQLEPMPHHYGCSIDIVNPADGELLDVIVLDDRDYDRGARTTVRVIDVLRRSDGDDKLLAVAMDRAWPSAERVAQARKEIWAWFERQRRPITHWGGEGDALAVIRACREAT